LPTDVFGNAGKIGNNFVAQQHGFPLDLSPNGRKKTDGTQSVNNTNSVKFHPWKPTVPRLRRPADDDIVF
jgi:hypothetical protein